MACRKRSNYRDSPSRVDDELRARVNSIEGEAVYDSWAEGAAMSTPGSSHRPRKKRKLIPSFEDPQSANLVVVDTKSNAVKPAFPLVAFLWPARGTSQWVVLPLILMIVGLFRWCAGLWGYSGYNVPPMHGDFEAQRHWMEITAHLPVSMWYFHDLPYWGLDYPPLTAYHSWLLGKCGSLINPAWFALESSRGFEEQLLKVYMRATVIVSEYLIYIPAMVIFLRHYSRAEGVTTSAASIALVAILMQPATILIDHAHFQYNTVMLGFLVASLSSVYAGRLLWACVFFVAALGFKQMALYYSPVMFAYLLGVCVTPRLRLGRLFGIALITAVSFAALFTPLLFGTLYDAYHNVDTHLPPPDMLKSFPIQLNEKAWYYPLALQISQSIHRIFPFARGLFEDKVANFWCALNTFYKLYRLPIDLQRIALYFTFMSILGPCLIIGAIPKKGLLPLALAGSAWGFFLFSFQVHEKSVLLPLLPMTLLLGSERGLSKEYRAWVGWANILGVWTLYPLLKRDELRTPYFVLTLLWAYLMGLPPTSLSAYYNSENQDPAATEPQQDDLHILTKLLHCGFYVAMISWHLAEAFIAPPKTKPDIFVVANVCIGAGGFGICYLWCLWKLVQGSGLLGDYLDHVQKVVLMRSEAGKKKTQ